MPMSITSLSRANRPWIKFCRFLFLLYCTALFLTGWWIGWVLLLLIVPAGGRLDIFERERRMRMGQHTIKLICCQTNLESNPRRGIGRHCTVHRLISSPIAAICFFDTPHRAPQGGQPGSLPFVFLRRSPPRSRCALAARGRRLCAAARNHP